MSSLSPLPGITREMIEESLELVRNYMNKIEGHYNDNEIAYEHFIMAASDGDALVAMLRYGLRYEEHIQARTISVDDWSRGEWHDA